MERKKAIQKVAEDDFTRLTAQAREELLLDWWSLRPGVKGAEDLPETLLAEMSRSEGPVEPPESVRYDPLVMYGLRARYLGALNSYLEHRLGFGPGEVLGEPDPLQPCPCCSYETLRARGCYAVCHVCFWEDTGDSEGYSSPNHMTLAEGRRNFEAFGACARRYAAHVDPDGPIKYRRVPHG